MTDLLSDRYGTYRPKRRALTIGFTAVLAVVGLAWIAWAAWFQATPEVESGLASYDVVDDHTATAVVHLRVSKSAEGGTCLLRAFAFDHTVVGELNFLVPTDRGRSFSSEHTVRTERRATAVELIGCTAADQVRPR